MAEELDTKPIEDVKDFAQIFGHAPRQGQHTFLMQSRIGQIELAPREHTMDEKFDGEWTAGVSDYFGRDAKAAGLAAAKGLRYVSTLKHTSGRALQFVCRRKADLLGLMAADAPAAADDDSDDASFGYSVSLRLYTTCNERIRWNEDHLEKSVRDVDEHTFARLLPDTFMFVRQPTTDEVHLAAFIAGVLESLPPTEPPQHKATKETLSFTLVNIRRVVQPPEPSSFLQMALTTLLHQGTEFGRAARILTDTGSAYTPEGFRFASLQALPFEAHLDRSRWLIGCLQSHANSLYINFGRVFGFLFGKITQDEKQEDRVMPALEHAPAWVQNIMNQRLAPLEAVFRLTIDTDKRFFVHGAYRFKRTGDPAYTYVPFFGLSNEGLLQQFEMIELGTVAISDDARVLAAALLALDLQRQATDRISARVFHFRILNEKAAERERRMALLSGLLRP